MNMDLNEVAKDISVVIPVYNKAKYLDRCIQSVLNQTIKPGEIIVVDDGSTDESLEILKINYAQKIKLITQDNSGESVARNNGVGLSKNSYVAFLDADDEWAPEFIEKISGLILDFPECSAFATAYKLVSENTKINPNYKNLVSGYRSNDVNYFEASLLEWSLLSSSSTVLSKKQFDKVGKFTPGLSLGADLDLWCRIALNGKIAFLNDPYAFYHYFNESSVTLNEVAKEELLYTKHLTKLLSSGQIPEIFQVSVKSFIAKGLQYLVCEQAKRGNYKILRDNLRDIRLYQYFGLSTLKMLFAIVVPGSFYDLVKRLVRT